MNQSEQIGELATALALAQRGMSLPKRNREVSVRSQSGTNYKFEYTTFDAIIEHVREPLTTNGLWFFQSIEVADGGNTLRTTLTHSSGQWISGNVKIPQAGKMQELGSALTYLRRYALSSLLGIASEDDDDANSADGNLVEAKKDKPPLSGVQPQGGSQPAPDKKAQANQWGAVALKTIEGSTSYDDLGAWHRKYADTIASVRGHNEALHKRIIAALEKKQNDLRGLMPVAAE